LFSKKTGNPMEYVQLFLRNRIIGRIEPRPLSLTERSSPLGYFADRFYTAFTIL